MTVTAALSLVCMLLFLGIRLVVRRPWNRLFGLDDWMSLSASVCHYKSCLVRDLADSSSGVRVVPEYCYAL